MPSSRGNDCSCCDKREHPYVEAVAFCPDCPLNRRLFCESCAIVEHRKGSSKQYHSVETIDARDTYAHIVSSMLFLGLAFGTFLAIRSFGDRYLAKYALGQEICPVTHGMRGAIYSLDTGVVYVLRRYFTDACALEDGYWRFLLDAWVRGILTSSDTWVLLVVGAPKAWAFHMTVGKYLIRPVVAIVYSIFCGTVYYIASFFPSPKRDSWLEWMLVAYDDFLERFLGETGGPPLTHPRTRPPMDFVDQLKYSIGSKIYPYKHFYQSAMARLSTLFFMVCMISLVLRVLCITLDIGWYLRVLGIGKVWGTGARTRYLIGKSEFSSDELSQKISVVVLNEMFGVVFFLVPPLRYWPMLFFLLPVVLYLGYRCLQQRKAFHEKAQEIQASHMVTSKLIYPLSDASVVKKDD